MSDYIASSSQEIQAMLESLGLSKLEELYSHLPQEVLVKQENWQLVEGVSEYEALDQIRAMAKKNKMYDSIFRGAGAYQHYIPSLVNHLASRSEFLTAYTPYQAEMSQGLLQSIFEYQTMICELTGMDASNASVYDGATAAAEAMLMCKEGKKTEVLVAASVHPQVIEVMKTYGSSYGMAIRILPCPTGLLEKSQLQLAITENTACLVLQQVNYFGLIEDAELLFSLCAENKVKTILHVNPIAAAILPSAKEVGAHIAVGEGQPLGMPLNFGGPYLGFMASVNSMMRKLPGRIVGQSTDHEGRRAFVLTLQAREQHIRREKASSSICSNQAQCALRAAIYCSAMGSEGIQEVANQCVDHAHYLADQLCGIESIKLKYDAEFFHEFVTISPIPSATILQKLEEANILGGLPLSEYEICWCATEVNRKSQIDNLVAIVKEVFA